MQASRSFGMIERDAGDTLQAENEGVVGYQIPMLHTDLIAPGSDKHDVDMRGYVIEVRCRHAVVAGLAHGATPSFFSWTFALKQDPEHIYLCFSGGLVRGHGT